MAGWRDNLRKASFRGVPFLYEATDDESGRRLAKHAYPGRDKPYTEDMGRKQRTYGLTAYLLGEDHMAEAERLVAACEAAGAGKLVHPYLGEKQVHCESARRRYSTGDGRMARVELSFVEAGANLHPAIGADTASAVDAGAAAALDDLAKAFEAAFTTAKTPGFVEDAAVDRIADLAPDIEAAISPALAGAAKAAELAALAQRTARLAANARTLVRDPAALAAEVLGVLADAGQAADAAARHEGLLKIAATPAAWTATPGATPSRQRQAANQAALALLARRGAVIEAAKAAARMPFATADAAWAARETLTDRLDTEILAAAHADVPGLTGLLAATATHLARQAPSLPRVVRHVAAASQPALRLAYEIYGDDAGAVIGRAAEIASRNRLRHPGMAPGGVALEILTRVGA